MSAAAAEKLLFLHIPKCGGSTFAKFIHARRLAGEEPGPGECDLRMLETAKAILCRHFRVVGTSERFDEELRTFQAANRAHVREFQSAVAQMGLGQEAGTSPGGA